LKAPRDDSLRIGYVTHGLRATIRGVKCERGIARSQFLEGVRFLSAYVDDLGDHHIPRMTRLYAAASVGRNGVSN
jgi:hypothetical protein